MDWGTSNLRAWAMDDSGKALASASSDKGMGRLERSQFAAALEEVCANFALPGRDAMDVLICGMAGARQGWLEAPYLEAPIDLLGLSAAMVRPDMPDSRLRPAILPGVCQRRGGDNVMRGEETQLLGLSATLPFYKGLVCMPGTHSKWALLHGSHIEHFSTAMTGELFELLKTHSVLRHSLAGDMDGPARAEGFEQGARDGLDRPEDLLGALFRVRASALLSARQADWCAGYLSGLLIGTEVAANRAQIGADPVPLIGSATLCAYYAQVLAMAGAAGQVVDTTEVVLAGLRTARAQLV